MTPGTPGTPGTSGLGWLAALLLGLWCFGAPRPAAAHGFRPGVLTLEEHRVGDFSIRWTPPVDTRYVGPTVEVVFPDTCRRENRRLRCGPSGLREDDVEFVGLADQRAPVMVRASFVDGRSVEAMVWPAAPTWSIGSRAAPRSRAAWIYAGVHHIFGGFDHLAFLAGLLMIVGLGDLRRLLATVTAFTVAHSGALMLAALGWVHVRAAPVEATIAASVLLVAREGMRRSAPPSQASAAAGSSWTGRWPWAVAFVFGLVHGLGFAGALDGETSGAALVSTVVLFNVGVELGQLALVVLSYVLVQLMPSSVRRLRTLVSYALGSLAAYWLIERTWALLTAGS